MADTFNHFDDIIMKLHKEARRIVHDTCADIETDIHDNAPVATGFLASSSYRATADDNTYGHTEGTGDLLPAVDGLGDDLTGYAAVGARYGIFVNNGTRYQAANPFFDTAVEANREPFTQAFMDLEDSLK